MSNYVPIWQPPDPPQAPEEKCTITCPFCGSDETSITKKYTIKGKIVTLYECYDCDKEWTRTDETVDNDDIPF